MSADDRPLLRAKEQIRHLQEKGVVFNVCSEDDALEYLRKNNNYFKLRAFRKGFYKHTEGPNIGKYSHLDFAYLKDLSTIDMRLRYFMLPIALDIEHSAKVKLLEKLDQIEDDGYSSLKNLLMTNETLSVNVKRELNQSARDPYCHNLVEKYKEDMPAWVFLEVVSFGSFMSFYKYIGEQYSDAKMVDEFYLLQSVKRLRNACAHSNCILNDLSVHKENLGSKSNINYGLRSEIRSYGISRNMQEKKMSNPRIFDIVTTLYAHKKIVSSQGLSKRAAENIQELKERMYYHFEYYDTNDTIKSSFEFISKLIDLWFPVV